jgi:hypothetical protein
MTPAQREKYKLDCGQVYAVVPISSFWIRVTEAEDLQAMLLERSIDGDQAWFPDGPSI